MLDDTCEEVVRKGWNSLVGEFMQKHLATLAHDLSGWSSQKFRKLGDQIKKVEKKLNFVQQQPISESSCDESRSLEKQLDDLHEKQEAY